jgi:hypothetical protein
MRSMPLTVRVFTIPVIADRKAVLDDDSCKYLLYVLSTPEASPELTVLHET